MIFSFRYYLFPLWKSSFVFSHCPSSPPHIYPNAKRQPGHLVCCSQFFFLTWFFFSFLVSGKLKIIFVFDCLFFCFLTISAPNVPWLSQSLSCYGQACPRHLLRAASGGAAHAALSGQVLFSPGPRRHLCSPCRHHTDGCLPFPLEWNLGGCHGRLQGASEEGWMISECGHSMECFQSALIFE